VSERVEDIVGPEGHWVVVVKGRVVATSENLGEMLRLAEHYPPSDTLVTKILYSRSTFF